MTAPPPVVPRQGRGRDAGRVRQALRRGRFWVGFGVLAVLAVAVALLIGGIAQTGSLSALSPTGASPTGSRALVRVLEAHGVHVVPAASQSVASAALRRHPDATLLMYDPVIRLPMPTARALAAEAAQSVLIRPSRELLETLAPQVQEAGATSRAQAPEPSCGLLPASVGAIFVAGASYRVTGGATGCFPVSAGRYAVARTPGPHPVTVVGSEQLFENGTIARGGNAAAAIGLLGAHRTLVWYLPTEADAAGAGRPSLAALTPGWVTPLAALAAAVALAAIVWRGRRLGPLVVESLPVTVPAGESTEGRARLYERHAARGTAARNLREGTAARLAARLRVAPGRDETEVADAAADLLGEDPGAVRSLLAESVPAGDADLMRLSAGLTDLEARVRRAQGGQDAAGRPDRAEGQGRSQATPLPEGEARPGGGPAGETQDTGGG